MIEYKTDWERELEERERLGTNGPEPVPHPDHIVFDPETGLIRVKGPSTKEEKAAFDWLRARKAECDLEIAENEQFLKESPEPKLREIILQDIEREKKLRAKICTVIPDERPAPWDCSRQPQRGVPAGPTIAGALVPGR